MFFPWTYNRHAEQIGDRILDKKLRKYEAEIKANTKKFIRKFQPQFLVFAKKIEPDVNILFSYNKKTCITIGTGHRI